VRRVVLAVLEIIGVVAVIAGLSGLFDWSIPVALIGAGAAVVVACEVRG
jgi:hypothetical protein